MRELTERELSILRDSNRVRKVKALFRLDLEFNFNRMKLAKYLSTYNLYGLSKSSIYRYLGNSPIRFNEYKQLKNLVKRGIIDQLLLDIIVAKNMRKRIESVINGSE